jgi:hypothetical protein
LKQPPKPMIEMKTTKPLLLVLPARESLPLRVVKAMRRPRLEHEGRGHLNLAINLLLTFQHTSSVSPRLYNLRGESVHRGTQIQGTKQVIKFFSWSLRLVAPYVYYECASKTL